MSCGRCIGGIIGFLILIGFFIAPVMADNEPNNSLNDPEMISEGTHSGDVSINLLTDNDIDYYLISVPANKDIKITAEKKDSGEGSITIQGYDSDKESMGIFGLWIYLTAPGETETDSYWNSEDAARNVYLEVEGDGEYAITIKFTTDSQDTSEGLAAACGLGLAGLICIPLLFIGFIIIIIVVIIIIVKKKKK